jgi:hypothetical protein
VEDEGGVGARQSVLVELHIKQSVPPQQPARARGLPRRALFCTYGCKELRRSLRAPPPPSNCSRSAMTGLCRA